jgi:hypothetical protein
MDANGRELRDQFRNSLLGLVEQPRMDANKGISFVTLPYSLTR